MKKSHLKCKVILLSLLTPSLIFAQVSDVQGVINIIGAIINSLIPIVVALALLYFFWGLARFILNSSEDKGREEAKNIMVWGIIALFVMLSVWGIVGLIGNTLGIGQGGAIDIGSITP